MTGRMAAIVLAGLMLASCSEVSVNIPASPEATKPAAAPTAAARTEPTVRGAVSGAKQYLRNFMSINPDCSSMGYAKVTIASEPSKGKVVIEQGEAYPDFTRENIRSRCNDRKLPAVMVFYQSEPGFVGTDQLVLEAVSTSGTFYHQEFLINVR